MKTTLVSCDLSLWSQETLNLEGLSCNNLPHYSFGSNVQIVVQAVPENIEKNGVGQYKHETIHLLNNNNNSDNNIIVASRLIVESITNINHVILKT